MPSSRYAEIAPRVKALCAKYGLPYNSGPFFRQWGGVQRTILRLAFPGGKPRPKPGPYRPQDADELALLRRLEAREPEPDRTGPDESGPQQRDAGVRFEMPDRVA
jgi:linoleoyl-CoA desaturase